MLSVNLAKKISQRLLGNHKTQAPCSTCSTRGVRVAVVGAAGGIGQPLCLLLKQNPLISTLVLHDIANVKGVVADLSHICTSAEVKGYEGDKQLERALEQASIVVVPAGLPRKPGMTRADLLNANGGVARRVAKAVSVSCPKAMLALITNPINTIVPIAAEVLKQEDAYDPKRLFGVTTLDVVRAKTFIAEKLGIDPQCVSVPVVGGHAGVTILPLVSQSHPQYTGDECERSELVKRIQEAGTEVVKAKAGKGSATLSMAFAGAHFVNALLRAMQDEESVVECAYVQSDVSEATFFATPVLLGPKGIRKNLGLPEVDENEEQALECVTSTLLKDIEVGVKFAE